MKCFGFTVNETVAHGVFCFLLGFAFSGSSMGSYAYGAEPKPASVIKTKSQHRRCVLRMVPAIPSCSYSATDTLAVEMSFFNDSAYPVFLRDEKLADWPSLLPCLTAKDAGRYVNSSFIPSGVPPARSKADFVKVDPHSSYKITFNLALSEFGIERNGTYELFFRYKSPSARGASFGLRVWSTEDGTVESEKLLLRIGNWSALK